MRTVCVCLQMRTDAAFTTAGKVRNHQLTVGIYIFHCSESQIWGFPTRKIWPFFHLDFSNFDENDYTSNF